MRIIHRSPSLPSKIKYTPENTLSLLQCCTSLTDFNQLHAQILRRGQTADPFVATKMLESLAASCNMGPAVQIFNSLPHHNVYTWTAMIKGFVAVKTPRESIHFYTLMRSFGIEPYKFTFLYVLKAYSMLAGLREGRIVHSTLIKLRLNLDLYLRTALVNLYSSCGDICSAFRVFEEVHYDNNSVIWNAMIVACFANGDIMNGRRFLDEIPNRDLTAWNAAINGYSKCGRVDLAKELFDEMPKRDLLSWSAMLVGYVQNHRAAEALDLFQEMLIAGVRPDGVTIATVISACAQIGALDAGKWIHAYTNRNKLWCDVVLGTSLVDMYSKCGCIELARQVFNGMESKNVTSWNAIICGLTMNGRGHDAIALFGRMESSGVAPNDITFVGVLTACCHIGALDDGYRQFDRMYKEYNIVPKIEHYGCMVDLFCRAGLLSEAGELIKSMPMEPNPFILGSFLSACMMHGNANVSENVIEEIMRMSEGDGGCHVLLSNTCASKNHWDGVAKIRRWMKGTGYRKFPGCSSIEVSSAVQEFIVEDQSHPEWKEVSKVVERLSWALRNGRVCTELSSESA